MLNLGWSSAICRNTRGLFYFILNISIPPVLLGNGRIQTPAGSMEQARERSNSSCVSEAKWAARGSVFLLWPGVCRVGIWQQRWARSPCTRGGHTSQQKGGEPWTKLSSVSSAEGRGREAGALLPQPCGVWPTVMAKLFWRACPLTISVLW